MKTTVILAGLAMLVPSAAYAQQCVINEYGWNSYCDQAEIQAYSNGTGGGSGGGGSGTVVRGNGPAVTTTTTSSSNPLPCDDVRGQGCVQETNTSLSGNAGDGNNNASQSGGSTSATSTYGGDSGTGGGTAGTGD